MLIKRDRFYIEQYGDDRFALVVTNRRLAIKMNRRYSRYPAGTDFQDSDETLFISTWRQLQAVFRDLGVKDLPRPTAEQENL